MLRSTLFTSCLLATVFGAKTRSEPDEDLPPMFGGRIKHFIAVMFENRSFDHFLGYLRANRSEIDGCLPSLGANCSNPVDPRNPDQDIIFVDNHAVYIQPGDPSHGIPDTSQQLFGFESTDIWPPPMNGFIYNYAVKDTLPGDNGTIIMQCFDSSAVPIITTLANEFMVFDRWYADVPGPTDPNRLYAWMATSSGMGRDVDWRLGAGVVGKNIFEMLDETVTFTNDTWRVYYQQAPTPIYVEYTRRTPRKFAQMDKFFEDLKTGDLPLFTWLDPAYWNLYDFAATDEHPDHDVTHGEKFLKRLYESLRQSPVWEDTLLLIFFDEHGGFFDHVPPPLAVSPDGRVATDVTPPFNFTRYGLRIPAVLVSPYIEKGSISDRPDPESLSQYSHSSFVHTLREQFAPSYPPLTKRDEISLTFEQILSLDYPRQDCPTQLPDVPSNEQALLALGWKEAAYGAMPVNGFQTSLASAIAPLCGASYDDVMAHSKNQDTMGRFVMDCTDYFVNSEK